MASSSREVEGWLQTFGEWILTCNETLGKILKNCSARCPARGLAFLGRHPLFRPSLLLVTDRQTGLDKRGSSKMPINPPYYVLNSIFWFGGVICTHFRASRAHSIHDGAVYTTVAHHFLTYAPIRYPSARFPSTYPCSVKQHRRQWLITCLVSCTIALVRITHRVLVACFRLLLQYFHLRIHSSSYLRP